MSASRERDTSQPFDPGETLYVCPTCKMVIDEYELIVHKAAHKKQQKMDEFCNEISAIMSKIKEK